MDGSHLLKEIEKTFRGSYDGLHGYQVLPDCEIEKHSVEECARCLIKSMI